MFAVSAMSVQNLNAQDDKTVKPAQQSINDPKPKQQVTNAEQATTKDNNGKVVNDTKLTSDPNVSDDSQEPMRSVMKPQGQKENSVKKTVKKNDSGEKTTGKSTLKKSRPKKVSKNQKMKDETQSGVQKPNEAQQGNEGKPSIKKSKNETIKNETQSGVQKPDQNQQGNENDIKKNKINKNQKMPDGTQSGVQKPNQNQEGKESKTTKNKVNNHQKMPDGTQSGVQKPNEAQQGNDKPTLQKDEPKPQPNNVVRPRQKVQEGNASGNNNGTM